jgi:hypothetical protein
MDDEFWCRFYRLMVHVHQENEEVSVSYVRKALPLLRKGRSNGLCLKEQLYLLGEYNRLAGDEDSAEVLLRKAGRTSVNHNLIVLLLALNCTSLLLGLYLVRQCRVAIRLITGLLVAVAVLSVSIYFALRQPQGYNEYLDQIITDRLVLLINASPVEDGGTQQSAPGDATNRVPEP